MALVTGAASGLGSATAQHLHSLGMQVFAIDLPASVARVREKGLHAVTYVEGDVRDEVAVGQAVDAACRSGDLRVVVNRAGVGDPACTVGRDGPLEMGTVS